MKQVVIDLKKECGEFCTERSHPKLPWLRDQIEKAITDGEMILFDRRDLKMLTTSFVDEMLSELALKHGLNVIKKQVLYSPPLEPIYEQQIERGMRLRKGKR